MFAIQVLKDPQCEAGILKIVEVFHLSNTYKSEFYGILIPT